MSEKIPKRYAPKSLTRRDRKKQLAALKKSRRAYKKGLYIDRPKVKSFKSKTSSHIITAKKAYKVDAIKPSKELSKATGCSIKALEEIERRGEGAFYSSGSRPNQTPASWGRARLASSITGGPAAKRDWDILKEGCEPKPQTSTKETIIEIKPSTRQYKKYMAKIKDNKTNRIKTIHFGDNRYPQYRDSTNVGKYSELNHKDLSRRKRYFTRHSGIPTKKEAVADEFEKSNGRYNAKLLSHIYLW